MNINDFPQPLGFYHALVGRDDLHYGYWPDGQTNLNLLQAQDAYAQMILKLLPVPPARILNVGCGLGAIAGFLAEDGYQVVAIAPSDSLISYARSHHPGPGYISCGFMDECLQVNSPEHYDVILFQESLQYLSDLGPVFDKAKKLLSPEKGRLIISDKVSYDHAHSCVHEAKEIERVFAEHGFFVQSHKRIGKEVAPSCQNILHLFHEKYDHLLQLFGNNAQEEIGRYIKVWQKLQQDYQAERLGYEVWDLRQSSIVVRSYCPGDENEILKTFRSVFNTSRSMEHWQWKFNRNPFGGPYASLAWDNSRLVSHYTAYPVPVCLAGQECQVYQVGDTLTVPAYRGVGRGETSLLARVTRHFHRQFCENKIPFFYGFLTGKHKKFGHLYLNYHSVAPVYEWHLEGKQLQAITCNSLRQWLHGYTIEHCKQVGSWANRVYVKTMRDYGSLVARTKDYLQWRYQKHPDYNYYFFVVRRWGQPVGWWLGRVEDNVLLLGDALFCKNAKEAPFVGLAACLRALEKDGTDIQQVRGWFSETPGWWNEKLLELEFCRQRHPYDLDFCITPFTEDIDPEKIGRSFYFTYGDSDLF